MSSWPTASSPRWGWPRPGPGQPPEVTDAELVCLAVAQVLLRYDDERHWLRVARSRVGHLFPRLLGQSGDKRLKNTAPLMQAALRWLADQTPGSAEMLRLRPSRNGVLGPMARHSEHVHRLHSGHGDPGRVARRTLCSPGGRRLRAGGEPLAVLLADVGSSRPPRRARGRLSSQRGVCAVGIQRGSLFAARFGECCRKLGAGADSELAVDA